MLSEQQVLALIDAAINDTLRSVLTDERREHREDLRACRDELRALREELRELRAELAAAKALGIDPAAIARVNN